MTSCCGLHLQGMYSSLSILIFMSLECTSWLDWCEFNWLCGTVYDMETYHAGPPPPCPPPPPNYHPPVQPGTCRFNITSGKCNFFPNTTGKTVIVNVHIPPYCVVMTLQAPSHPFGLRGQDSAWLTRQD